MNHLEGKRMKAQEDECSWNSCFGMKQSSHCSTTPLSRCPQNHLVLLKADHTPQNTRSVFLTINPVTVNCVRKKTVNIICQQSNIEVDYSMFCFNLGISTNHVRNTHEKPSFQFGRFLHYLDRNKCLSFQL